MERLIRRECKNSPFFFGLRLEISAEMVYNKCINIHRGFVES